MWRNVIFKLHFYLCPRNKIMQCTTSTKSQKHKYMYLFNVSLYYSGAQERKRKEKARSVWLEARGTSRGAGRWQRQPSGAAGAHLGDAAGPAPLRGPFCWTIKHKHLWRSINETRASTEMRMMADVQELLRQGEEVNQQDSQGATLVRLWTPLGPLVANLNSKQAD